MFNGLFHIREPNNEPILGYESGTAARTTVLPAYYIKETFLPPTNYRYPFMVEP